MFLFVPREMGIGLVLDERPPVRLAAVGEEPGSRRSVECPFTVEPGAEGLPAGALLDMGRTLGLKRPPGSTDVCGRQRTARGTVIRWEGSVGKGRARTRGDNVLSREAGAGTRAGR
jgi:hypothetical protein